MTEPEGDRSVRRLLEECAELARRTDDRPLSDGLNLATARLAKAGETRPVVVVVGATKAGKSALINALLRRPGLSPVDDLVATNAYIEFVASEKTYASVYFEEKAEALSVDPGTVAEWVTEQGNPGNYLHVRSAEIGLNVPLVHEMTLIDTPGTGGVKAAHLALTLIALGFADALVFVVDGQRELTESALRFLADAAERTETVVLAVTKKDKYHHINEVLALNRRLLSEHAPRFAQAPIIDVSSRLAVQALQAEEPLAGALRRESGVDELEAALHDHVVARAGELGRANALQHALSVLDALERRLSDLRLAGQSDTGFRETAAAEIERLATERGHATGWEEQLGRELEAVRATELDRFALAVAKLIGEYGKRARNSSDPEAEAIFKELDEDITEAAAQILRTTTRKIPDVVRPILEQIDAASVLEGNVARFEAQMPDLTIHAPIPSKGMDGASALTSLLSRTPGIASQLNWVGVNAHVAVGMPPLAVATLLIGGAYTVFRYKRDERVRRDRLEEAVAEETRRAERLIGDAYRQQIEDLRADLCGYVQECVERRQNEVERLIHENELALQRSASEQTERRRELERDMERVQELREAAFELLHQPVASR